MVRTLPLDSETRPDLSRILGIAAAIAVHALAFMLLLVPMATPVLQRAIVDRPDVFVIEPKKKIEEVVITQKQPKPITDVKTPPKATEKPVVVTDPPVIVEGGDVATSGPVSPDPGPIVGDPGPAVIGPISVGNLAYVKATPPPYPRAEIRAGVQGTVLLKVLVDVDGKPLEVVVLESSGNKALDRSAREHVLKTWLFQPAMRDGQAVQAYGKVPVVFSMQ